MDCDFRMEWILLFRCCHSVYSTISLQSNGQTVNDFSSVFFSIWKSDWLGPGVLCCFALLFVCCLISVASFLLPSASLMYMYLCVFCILCVLMYMSIYMYIVVLGFEQTIRVNIRPLETGVLYCHNGH